METNVFTPLADFFSPDLQSGYCKGLTYTIRPGNERLAELATEWAAAGMIEFVDAPATPTVRLSGVAEVKRA